MGAMRQPIGRVILAAVILLTGLPARAAIPAYTLIGAEDWSEGDFFRVRFRVKTAEPINAQSAEAIARDLVERRTKRRVLHVAEVRVFAETSAPDAPPDAVVMWAPGGNPSTKPIGLPGDYSMHTFTVHLGAAAAEAARLTDRQSKPPPPPEGANGEATAAAPAPGEGSAETPAPRSGKGVLSESAPPPAPIPVMDTQALARAELLSVLRGWHSAWEARDLNAYLAYYAPDFRSGSMNLAGWSAHKAQVFERASEIRVGMDDIQVSFQGPRATATFVQEYRADDHRDKGKKTLVFEKVGGAYKIVLEDWSAL